MIRRGQRLSHRSGSVEIRSAIFERAARRVLEVPSLSFDTGAIVLVRGANGTGKSTLLRAVAGLESPVQGSVLVGGDAAGSPAARRRIAFAPQTPVFFRGSVRYNLELPATFGRDDAGAVSGLDETAALLGIVHLLDRPATELSGGEAQRANVARAVLAHTPVTLLDEPLAGMDDSLRADLLQRIVEVHRAEGRTLVVASHEPAEEVLADVVVRLPIARLGEQQQQH